MSGFEKIVAAVVKGRKSGFLS